MNNEFCPDCRAGAACVHDMVTKPEASANANDASDTPRTEQIRKTFLASEKRQYQRIEDVFDAVQQLERDLAAANAKNEQWGRLYAEERSRMAALEAYRKYHGVADDVEPWKAFWEPWKTCWQLATQAAYERAKQVCATLQVTDTKWANDFDELNAWRRGADDCADAISALSQGELEAPAPVTVEGWMPISTAPLGKMVQLIGGGWRHAFPGSVCDRDTGMCILDTPTPEHDVPNMYAQYWCALPAAPKVEG